MLVVNPIDPSVIHFISEGHMKYPTAETMKVVFCEGLINHYVEVCMLYYENNV